MKESEWQTLITRTAKAAGWACYHTHDSRRSQPGFPDFVMARGDRLLAVELKSDTAKSVPIAQVQWLLAFARAGCEAYLWTPADWQEASAILGDTVFADAKASEGSVTTNDYGVSDAVAKQLEQRGVSPEEWRKAR